MLGLVYLGMLRLDGVLGVTIGIIGVFVSLFIYIKYLGTVLVARAIIIKVISNSELTGTSELVTAGDPKLTTLAKGTVSAIAAAKASVFKAPF
jgi:hypothetical protein